MRYPLQTHKITEVPESLETSQKLDRRRDCIFQNSNNRSNNNESLASSMYDRHSSAYNNNDQENVINFQLLQGFNWENSLESPVSKHYATQH